MEIVQHKQYQSHDVLVSAVSRELVVRGVPQRVRAKTFELLLYLIQHRDRPVGREELFEAVWNGVAVSENSLAQCVIELRKALGDDARNPRFIKTIAKLGYRFIGPIEAAVTPPAVGFAPPAVGFVPPAVGFELEEVTTTHVEIEKPDGWKWLAGAALLFAVAGAILFPQWRKTGQPETVLPSVAGKRPVVVMYFENQSQSADLDWLSAGLADMVIANLSRSGKLAVLSRQQLESSLRRAGKKGPLALQDAMEMATRSRASVMVLGSFSKMGDQVRIAAQIHDSGSGRLLAAESVTAERPEQILTRVDTLALVLARDLGVPLHSPRTGLATLMTSNLEAYRHYSLGLEKAHALDDAKAVELFQKALSLDPNFVMAQARIGYTLAITAPQPEQGRDYLEKAFQRSRDLTASDRLHIAAWYATANQDYADAIHKYRELLAIDPTETESYMRLGRLLRGERRQEEAIEVLNQGLAVDPDAADVVNALGSLYSQLGRHAEAIALEQRYVALAPAEANSYDSLGLAYAWAGRAADAEQAYRKALELRPGFEIARRHLSMLYFQTGRYRAGLREGELAIEAAASDRQRGLAHSQLADLLALTGQPQRAWREVEIARRFEPASNGAFAAVKSGHFRRAAELMAEPPPKVWTNRGERLINEPRIRSYLLGEIALAENRSSEALADFREALRYPSLWSMPVWLEDCLADAYLRLGRLDEAIAEYQRVLDQFPGGGLARYHLAVVYRRKGDLAHAKAEYRRFLELWIQADPDVPELIDARAELKRIAP